MCMDCAWATASDNFTIPEASDVAVGHARMKRGHRTYIWSGNLSIRIWQEKDEPSAVRSDWTV